MEPNNNKKQKFDINEIQNMINDVNKNIMNVEDKLNKNKTGNSKEPDYKKNNDFNMGKIGFYNQNNQNQIKQNSNDMIIDDNPLEMQENNNQLSNEDDLIIKNINETHSDISKILKQRKSSLSRVSKFCLDKDLASTLNYLNMINDLAVYNDYLNYSLLQTDTPRVPLTMDNANFLLAHVSELINSKYENYNKVGLSSAHVILKLFADRIVNTKCSPNNGIDLSKEDRIKKCDKILDIYKQIKGLNNINVFLNSTTKENVIFLFS